jgi:hypothetical protein
MTFLRFTCQEHRAIVQACRPLDLSDRAFPAFKPFLVGALAAAHPALAERVARFHTYQAGIVSEHLRERRRKAGQARTEHALTAGELRAMRQACTSLRIQPRFLTFLRQFLVHRFHGARPELARKLGRLSDRQLERLTEGLPRRPERSA